MSSKKSKIVTMTMEEAEARHRRGEYGKTDWNRLETMTDDEIEAAVRNDPDAAPILDADFWKDAQVVTPTKQSSITLPIDADVLDWFKSQGNEYQTRMNTVLRSYMEKHRKTA
jgi:uncharacterized protein (DUF4415 family)